MFAQIFLSICNLHCWSSSKNFEKSNYKLWKGIMKRAYKVILYANTNSKEQTVLQFTSNYVLPLQPVLYNVTSLNSHYIPHLLFLQNKKKNSHNSNNYNRLKNWRFPNYFYESSSSKVLSSNDLNSIQFSDFFSF